LLFWIVQRAIGTGPAVGTGPKDADVQLINYLISQGADCKVTLSFLEFNRNALKGEPTYEGFIPMMQNCAK
jgi:hypothetical protein